MACIQDFARMPWPRLLCFAPPKPPFVAADVPRTVGLVAGFGQLWLNAWLTAWLVAFPVVLIIAPLTRRIVQQLIKDE